MLRDADARGERVLILGGGSNLVVRDEGWDGLCVQLAMSEVSIIDHGRHAFADAAAGVVWDDFVAQMVDAGYAGIECMSGIPGMLGATPIQNVGAYGQEVSDSITSVRALDRATGELVTFAPSECGFAYRTSMFKGNTRWIVLAVRFKLTPGESRPIRYAELCKALGVADGGTAPLRTVRETVIRLRRGKGMVVDPDDPESRSAGSFFTNPIVDAATLAALEAHLPAGVVPPRFAAPGGLTKLSAAWLIERAGFAKGTRRGGVGISNKHALALVNRGGTASELLALAKEIQDGVRERLGIELHPEPVIV